MAEMTLPAQKEQVGIELEETYLPLLPVSLFVEMVYKLATRNAMMGILRMKTAETPVEK